MKKIIVIFIIILISFKNTQSQIISTRPDFMDLNSDIILVGVEHNADSLLCKQSSDMFCNAYPEIIKKAGSRPVIILMEGVLPEKIFKMNNYIKTKYKFPICIKDLTPIKGCDTRKHDTSINFKSRKVLTLMNYIYMSVKQSIEIEKLNNAEKDFFLDNVKIVGESNIIFENSVASEALSLYRMGYFVVVLIGASHVCKIINEKKIPYAGHVICTSNFNYNMAIKQAKLLKIIENFKK
jgi:hypothetical protein